MYNICMLFSFHCVFVENHFNRKIYQLLYLLLTDGSMLTVIFIFNRWIYIIDLNLPFIVDGSAHTMHTMQISYIYEIADYKVYMRKGTQE
jgi:hypothetical protein